MRTHRAAAANWEEALSVSKFSSGGRFEGTRGSRDDGFRKVKGFTTRIHPDRQGKHIPGHKNCIPGRSVLRLSIAEAQKLIEEYAGTGAWFEPNKEAVDFHVAIGIWKKKGGQSGLETTRGTIHYSKGGCHIVLARPEEDFEHDR